MTKKLMFGVLVVILLAAGGAYYFYYVRGVARVEYDSSSGPSSASSKNPQQDASELVAAVGKLIVLPEGETPTVATVSDPDRLRDQPFFAKAKQGDKVLLYPNAKKAYLYDPVAGRLLEVAPINFGADSAGTKTDTQGSVQSDPKVKVKP